MSIYGNPVMLGGSGGGGGGDVPLLTRAQWDALSTAQKQAYGLLAIQDANSGYTRGELVYGASYIPIGAYIPYSNSSKVLCEAYSENYSELLPGWGYGTNPVLFTSRNYVEPYSQDSDAIYIPTKAYNNIAYVDLEYVKRNITTYVVMKGVSLSGYNRVVACMETRASGAGFAHYGNPVTISTWGNSYNSGISATSDYFVIVNRFNGSELYALVNDDYSTNISLSRLGRYFTLGRTDIDPGTSNAEPSDIAVKYVAVVDEVESDTVIQNNVSNLMTEFGIA